MEFLVFWSRWVSGGGCGGVGFCGSDAGGDCGDCYCEVVVVTMWVVGI